MGIKRQQLLHGVLAQHFRQRAGVGLGAVPQHQLLAVVLQQQLGGARKGVGQGVAHGGAAQGVVMGVLMGAGA